MHSFLLSKKLSSNFTMTATPPLSVYLPRPRSPKIVYSNLPTLDDYIPPLARHAVWWLENTDIFLSIKGIVYGLRRIHFTQSSLFRHLLDDLVPLNDLIPPLGDPRNPIPFDKIHPSSFYEVIYLLHISEMFDKFTRMATNLSNRERLGNASCGTTSHKRTRQIIFPKPPDSSTMMGRDYISTGSRTTKTTTTRMGNQSP